MTAGPVFQVIAFAVSAFVAVAGALGMATTMSMFRSGIFLMASFVGTAALFLLLSADLLGLLQVMMYLGGMLVMVLFMVLFMHDPGGAMMAGMEGMAAPERWFSRGLIPQAKETDQDGGHGGHGSRGGDHDPQHDRGAGPGAGHAEHGGGHDPQAHRASHGAQGTHHAHSGDHGPHGAGHGGKPAGGHQPGGGPKEHGAGVGAHDGHQGGGAGMSGMDMSMVTPVRSLAVWLAAAAGVPLGAMLLLRPAWRVATGAPDPDSARAVGELLMGKYMVAFEGAGLLILIGIFGAVLMARPSAFPDDATRAGRVAVDAPPEPVGEEGLAPAAPCRGGKENGA